MSPEAEVDMSFNGISVFGFCVSKSSAFISLIETGIAFLDWKERPQPHLPIFVHRITVETLGVHKGKVRKTVSIALVIGGDFNTAIPPDTKAMHSHV